MDLGFGDRVDPIEYPMDLIATSKGPLFESRISLHCYPKEFIFAEKFSKDAFETLEKNWTSYRRKIKAKLPESKKFLLELGQGFAFVGRQVSLIVDGREYFVDLLFYHLKLRR